MDTFLTHYNNKSLIATHVLLLISLIVILIHSFSIFLKVSSQDTYREVLNQQTSRTKVRILFVAIIFVYTVLYLMADWFSESIVRFLFASLCLGLGWTVIDFFSSSVIYAYYRSLNKPEDVDDDPLFRATENWWKLDILLCIWCVLVVIAVLTEKMKDAEAAVAMLIAFFAAAVLVEHGLPNQDPPITTVEDL